MTPDAPPEHASLTYASYLRIDELLALQRPRSEGPEHDEMLFIVIHQVYELWFKQLLHETRHLQRNLEEGRLPLALDTLHRLRNILKVLVSQVDVLETMTPIQFSSFRTRLEAASGFQSAQFREIEVALGKRSPQMLAHMPDGPAKAHLVERMNAPSVWESFLRFLDRSGHAVPKESFPEDRSAPLEPSPVIQQVLIGIYRRDPSVTMLCESLVDIDEGLQEWRYRHVKMVERTIGMKMGTGGSSGADYLRATLFKPLFPDLWVIRASL